MKAIRVHATGGPEVLHYEETPTPQPKFDEVLVKVDAAGVNFIDVYHRTGVYRQPMPFTPGQEGAGTVTEVGADVRTVRVGDRVAWASLPSGYAEYVAAPADRVVILPSGVTTRHAAAAMLQGLTAQYLASSTYPLKEGDTCLIHAGAGGVGLLLTQFAKLRGARTITTVSTEAKAALSKRTGADHVIVYTRDDFAAEVKELTHGRGVQVVYDSVGAATYAKSLDSLSPRGMLILYGQSSGLVPPFDPLLLVQKGSLYLTRPSLNNYVASRAELEQRSDELFSLMSEQRLLVLVDSEYPLANASDAHAALEARKTTGKLLLIP